MPTPSTVEVLEGIARTADVTDTDRFNYAGHRGLILFVNTTAIAATPSVVFNIQGKDEYTGQYYTIGSTAAVVAAPTLSRLLIYPGIVEVANTKVDYVLPLIWRLFADHADADSITYKVGVTLLP